MIESKDGVYKIVFDNLDKFYKECDIVEETGNYADPKYPSWIVEDTNDDPSFKGLLIDTIKKSKYMYKEGLNELEKLKIDLNLGGTKRSYKWDEVDGDDMNYDRYLDNLPCLRKRIRKVGLGQGKIINIHVSVAENCNIEYKDMLIRSYTVMKVIDYLEAQGYRIGLSIYSDVANLGSYNNSTIKMLHTEVQIKKPEEPLIKGLVLTCISPWMFRYHFFKLWVAKFKCEWGLGQTYYAKYVDSKTDIYFRSGTCLGEEDAKRRIKELKELFSFEE